MLSFELCGDGEYPQIMHLDSSAMWNLDGQFASVLARRDHQNRLRRLTIPARGLADFSSNDYLSLSVHPHIRDVFIRRLQAATASGFSLGSGGSRLLDGNSAAAEALESSIAAFHGADAGLLFNSGFEANTGLLRCVPQEADVVLYDVAVHASVHDGMRLSRARCYPFAHNCVETPHGSDASDDDDDDDDDNDDGAADATDRATRSLDTLLSAITRGPEGQRFKHGKGNVFVAVESVYSMDGQIAPLAAIVHCVERHLGRGNGYIIVDEAHATGWLGRRGRGLVNHLGLESRIWARVHTFGKAMGCQGAIVLCSPTTRAYLINYAANLIYTTALGPPALTAIRVVYEHLSGGHGEPQRRHLSSLIHHTHRLLSSLVCRRKPSARLFRIDANPGVSPILAVYTSRARSLANYCQSKGFLVRPIVAPTVPTGTDRVRVCLHAANSEEQVRGLCAVMEAWVLEGMERERTAGTAARF